MTRGCGSEAGGTVAALYTVHREGVGGGDLRFVMWGAFRRRGPEDAECRRCAGLEV